jgi:hypothetical protein
LRAAKRRLAAGKDKGRIDAEKELKQRREMEEEPQS